MFTKHTSVQLVPYCKPVMQSQLYVYNDDNPIFGVECYCGLRKLLSLIVQNINMILEWKTIFHGNLYCLNFVQVRCCEWIYLYLLYVHPFIIYMFKKILSDWKIYSYACLFHVMRVKLCHFVSICIFVRFCGYVVSQ